MDQRPDIALVPVEEDLDVSTVDGLRTTIDGLIRRGCRRVVLNMCGVSYIDSAGMALVLAEIRRMRAVDGVISLTNVSDTVLAILRRARVVDFVPVSAVASEARVADVDPAAQPLWRAVVPIDCDDLAQTRAAVSQLLERAPLSPDERFDAGLAVGEAMGNAVDHAGGADAVVSVAAYDDRAIIEVADRGEGFDVERERAKVIDPTAERGRGIRMMELLSDAVSISPQPCGPGTLVRIVKLAGASTD